ncbi:MAG: hypothetical protein ACKOEC_03015 [Acidimicrobiia bacterium]
MEHSPRRWLIVTALITAVGLAPGSHAQSAIEVRALTIPSEGAVLAADLYLPSTAARPLTAVVFVQS